MADPNVHEFHQLRQFQALAEAVIRHAVLDAGREWHYRKEAEEFLFDPARTEDLQLWCSLLRLTVEGVRDWARERIEKRRKPYETQRPTQGRGRGEEQEVASPQPPETTGAP
jgi:hypothetical protein